MLFKIALPFWFVSFWIAIRETEMVEEKTVQVMVQDLKNDLGPNRIIAAGNLLKPIDCFKKVAIENFVKGVFFAPDFVNSFKVIRHIFTLREIEDGLSDQCTTCGHQPTLDLLLYQSVF